MELKLNYIIEIQYYANEGCYNVGPIKVTLWISWNKESTTLEYSKLYLLGQILKIKLWIKLDLLNMTI